MKQITELKIRMEGLEGTIKESIKIETYENFRGLKVIKGKIIPKGIYGHTIDEFRNMVFNKVMKKYKPDQIQINQYPQ